MLGCAKQSFSLIVLQRNIYTDAREILTNLLSQSLLIRLIMDTHEKTDASTDPTHQEPTSLDKKEYVSEKEGPASFNDDELEPVVTPKTWLVVFVSTPQTLTIRS